MNDEAVRPARWWVGLILALLAIAPYAQTWNHQFINYDDNLYVTENPVVKGGLTWNGVAWAFSTYDGGNWHPLTWLTHSLDYTLFGDNPGPPHLENALWHALNTLLVWRLLSLMTGASWRSALVASLFAVHPLHVQSVAWVAERKDLLSTFFALLTMRCHLAFIRSRRIVVHAGMLLCFAASMMFKPMYVTLPALLLVLDWWPLRRWTKLPAATDSSLSTKSRLGMACPAAPFGQLVVEKLPMLMLAAGGSVMAVISQHTAKTMTSLDALPFAARAINAAVAYTTYLEYVFAPTRLAVIYPHPGTWPGTRAIWSIVVLVVVTAIAIVQWRKSWLLAGWLWFLGMLVPVIGLVQIGLQSMADRYMYFPIIGVFIMLAWSIAPARTAAGRRNWGMFAGLVVVMLTFLSIDQAAYWRDSRTLFTRAIQVTQNNFLAHQNLGNALQASGEVDAAIEQYRTAIAVRRNRADLHENLGSALVQKGSFADALEQFTVAVNLNHDSHIAYTGLGGTLLALQRYDEAERALSRALEIEPGNDVARGNHGFALMQIGRLGPAIEELQMVKKSHPERVGVRTNLALAFASSGRIDEAQSELDSILALRPDFAPARTLKNQLASTQGATTSPARPSAGN